MNKFNKIVTYSMIATLYDEKRLDRIGLLLPFLKSCINEKYSVDDKINNKELINLMEKKYNIIKIPSAVIEIMLIRLCNESYIEKRDSSFYYIKDLSKEVIEIDAIADKIEKSYTKFKENIYNLVQDRLNKNDKIEDVIYNFIKKYGFICLSGLTLNIGSSEKEDLLNKIIAKHILEDNDEYSLLEDFKLIVEGCLLMNVIYMNSEEYEDYETTEPLYIYLDTVLLLGALNLKDDDSYVNAQSIRELLPKNAKIRCFRHNYNEVESIIENYQIGNNTEIRRLAYFEKGKTKMDKELYLGNLEQKFKDLGIEIDDNKFDDNKKDKTDKLVIDYQGISNYITSKIGGGYSDRGVKLENDVNSIQYISFLRNGKTTRNLEECKAIFVSSNRKLVYHVNNYLHKKSKDYVDFAITDVDLISILWVKSTDYDQDFSKNYLIKYSYATVNSFSDSFLNKVAKRVNDYQKDDNIVLSIKNETQYFTRKVALEANGDIKNITDDFIEESVLNKEKEENPYLYAKFQEKELNVKKKDDEIESLKRELENKKDEMDRKDNYLEIEKRKTKRITEKKKKNIYNWIFYPCSILTHLLIFGILFIIALIIFSCIKVEQTRKFIYSTASSGLAFIFGYIIPFLNIRKKMMDWLKKKARIISENYAIKFEEKLSK